MPVVEVLDVKKIYKQGKVLINALNGVSLSFEKGEFTSLAGPSGSGKTTLLNVIGAIDSPDSGDVILDGNRYSEMGESKLADMRLHKIGFVFQAYNLVPVLSAVENVEYVLRLRGVDRRECRERSLRILKEVGLGGMEYRRPAELSGGQQQRVAVARAIVGEPAFVLADEPTANLDSKTSESLLEMMRQMNREMNITFIFATHDEMVMDFAGRVVRLRDGQVEDDIVK